MQNIAMLSPLKINKKMSTRNLAIFFRQLATLLSSSIPILQAFDMLRQNQPEKTLKQVLLLIKIDLESGNELSWCLAKFPRYFDLFTCQLVKIGEYSGTLPVLLNRIAEHKEKMLLIKNKIKQVLLYPTIIFFITFAVSILMLTVVIPHFATLFQSTHSSLPAFTLAIIHLSEFICHYYWLSLFPLLAVILLIYYLNHSRTLRSRIERSIIRLPHLGSIYMKLILCRFCRSLATTFAAGIPISECLKIIAHANGSDLYAQILAKLQVQITKGQQLHQSMHKQPLFPPLLVQMVKIGEESGTLEKMLEKIANIYESDMNDWATTCSRLLEPLIIAILGVLIGGLVIAMYLPIFKLGTVM